MFDARVTALNIRHRTLRAYIGRASIRSLTCLLLPIVYSIRVVWCKHQARCNPTPLCAIILESTQHNNIALKMSNVRCVLVVHMKQDAARTTISIRIQESITIALQADPVLTQRAKTYCTPAVKTTKGGVNRGTGKPLNVNSAARRPATVRTSAAL